MKLSGTINGEPIPWDIKTANVTPFTSIPDFAEKVQWKPVFKPGLVGQIERALKKYKSAVENTEIENGKVVGPKDASKEYYNGLYLDKMDAIFDEIATATKKFETFADDTAEVMAARKARDEANAFLQSKGVEPAKVA